MHSVCFGGRHFGGRCTVEGHFQAEGQYQKATFPEGHFQLEGQY